MAQMKFHKSEDTSFIYPPHVFKTITPDSTYDDLFRYAYAVVKLHCDAKKPFPVRLKDVEMIFQHSEEFIIDVIKGSGCYNEGVDWQEKVDTARTKTGFCISCNTFFKLFEVFNPVLAEIVENAIKVTRIKHD